MASEDQGPGAPDRGQTERVADADRDRTVTLLREHVVEGRLTLDEFSERMGTALEAKTRGELDAVMADLPTTSGIPSASPTTATPRKTSRWHIAIMSGHSTRGRWRIGGKTNAVAIMGGCDMDLRRAEIEGPEVEITAFAFWGGVEIIVPEGFDVELRGFSFMGGRSLRLRDVPIVPGSPRIIVRGFAVMGGIEVKSRPNRSAKQIGRRRSSMVQDALDTAAAYTQQALNAAADATPEGPVDLAALGRQIRRELHAQRHAYKQADRRQRRGDSAGTPGTPTRPTPPTPPNSTSTSTPTPTPTPAPTARPSSARASSSEPTTFEAPGEPEQLPTVGTVTILFCDMVDYAGMTERLGDHASSRILHEHHRIVREAVAQNGGREIKVQGDGFMVAFGGVAPAMRCAIDTQRACRDHVTAEGEKIAVHIGIHTGDAVVEDDDYLGHTVIVASRLADAASAGEILVSSLSEQLVQGSGEFSFDGHRETRLKGMARAQLSATLNWAD
jgi:class 3 adenylate cyclase